MQNSNNWFMMIHSTMEIVFDFVRGRSVKWGLYSSLVMVGGFMDLADQQL
jgi:hypothetical protein